MLALSGLSSATVIRLIAAAITLVAVFAYSTGMAKDGLGRSLTGALLLAAAITLGITRWQTRLRRQPVPQPVSRIVAFGFACGALMALLGLSADDDLSIELAAAAGFVSAAIIAVGFLDRALCDRAARR